LVFRSFQRHFFRDPGQFGQDVSRDPDAVDDAVSDDGASGEADFGQRQDEPVEEAATGPSALQELYDGLTSRREQAAGKPAQAAAQRAQKTAASAEQSVAGDIAKATRQKASQTGQKVAQKAASTAIQKGAQQVTARVAQVAAAAADLAGPVGVAIGAAVIAAQKIVTSKRFLQIFAVFCFTLAAMIFLLFFGLRAFVHSGQGGARETIPLTNQNAEAAVTKGQSVAAFVQNIDLITKDTDKLLNSNPKLSANAGKIHDLLNQLRDLRTQIEPAANNGQATAEQLKKYTDIVNQIKSLTDGDRKSLSDQVIALDGKNILLSTATCAGVIKDLKTLSVTTDALKVILAVNEYGRIHNKTMVINCLVSGHRKYVGKSPAAGYPYCGQPDNAQAAALSRKSQSWHCYGRAVDIQGTDQGLVTYLNSRSDLRIRKAFVEDIHHTHVEVYP
jgi:hypothetical protein